MIEKKENGTDADSISDSDAERRADLRAVVRADPHAVHGAENQIVRVNTV